MAKIAPLNHYIESHQIFSKEMRKWVNDNFTAYASSSIRGEKMNETKFYDERLSFPTKLAKAPGGIVEVYIIPDEKKKRRGIN